MPYEPGDIIYSYRSDLHDRLLASSAIRRTPRSHHVLMAAFFVTIFAIGPTQPVGIREEIPSPPSQEAMRSAAPETPKEDEGTMDNARTSTIEEEPPVEQNAPQERDMQMILDQPPPIPASIGESASPLYERFIERERALRNAGRRPHRQIGTYLTATSAGKEERRLREFADLERIGGNALVFDVKGSFVYFRSSASLASELGLLRPILDLPRILQEAKERGLYTIARFIAAKDPSLASLKRETQIEIMGTGRGIGEVWVDPGHETTITYNEEILRDLIASGIDEVNFDYIRYPTEYDQSAIGLSGKEKANRIERFLRMARSAVEEQGGRTKLGISTYAILGWNFPVNFEPLGQDIARFAPLVDVISPMAYPSTFAAGAYYDPAKNPGSRMYFLVYRTLMGYKELLGEDAWKLRPWIQGYSVTEGNILDEVHAVFDSGLCGFTVWNANNTYKAFFEAMENVEVPERCTE